MTPAEENVLQAVGTEFLREIDKQGKAFIRQTVLSAQQAGVPRQYLQYLFFLISEQRKNWPTMSAERLAALTLGRQIMIHSGDTLEYPDGLTVPPPEVEDNLNSAILALGFWCLQGLAAELIGEYARILKAHTSDMRRAKPDIPPRFEGSYLEAAFETALRTHPGLFLAPNLMRDVIEILF